jgi:hypothetical protein
MRHPYLWFGSALLIGAVALLAVIPNSASADSLRFSGTGAQADFYSFDEDDGSLTYAYAFVNKGKTTFHDPPGGPPETFSDTSVEIYISQLLRGDDPYDPTDDMIRDIYGFTTDADFQVDRFLTAATLNATVDAVACEYPVDQPLPAPEPVRSPAAQNGEPPEPEPCTETTLEVNLTWAGFGNISRIGANEHFHGPGFIVSSHFKGTHREAEVSGSITDGSSDFTGGETAFGVIFKARQGEVTID